MIPVTRADARLLRILATLTASLPPQKRAAHLAPKCDAFAARIEAATPKEDDANNPST